MKRYSDLSGKDIDYNSADDKDILTLISMVKEGVSVPYFMSVVKHSPFTLSEWSSFLHISRRTLQRHQKQKRSFDPLQSEKILQIALLSHKGRDVFGSEKSYHTWLDSESIALGGRKPKELLDNAFGIDMVRDELLRIEHGIMA